MYNQVRKKYRHHEIRTHALVQSIDSKSIALYHSATKPKKIKRQQVRIEPVTLELKANFR